MAVKTGHAASQHDDPNSLWNKVGAVPNITGPRRVGQTWVSEPSLKSQDQMTMEAFAPMRIALYRRLVISQMIFGVGLFMQVVAGNWLMLELTASPLWVGLMVASPHIPLLLLAVPSGALSDTVDRRQVLMMSATLMGISALGMTALHTMELLTAPRLLALGILMGFGLAFHAPAWHASIPNLVPKELLSQAVALSAASGGLGLALGPALGGRMVAAFGFAAPLTVAALSYAVLLLSVLSVRRVSWRDDASSDFRTAMATGIRYVRNSAGYGWLLLVAAMFGTSSAALGAMLPNITSDKLLLGPSTYGVLLAAKGVGALIGALMLERGVLLFGPRLVSVSIAAFGLAGIAVGLSRSLTITVIALVIAGVAWTWTLTTFVSTLVLLAPAWVRSRAVSIYILALFGLLPVSTILIGSVANRIGADSALILSSVAVVALSVAVLRRPMIDAAAVSSPEPVGIRPAEGHPDIRSDYRVMVSTSWTVRPDLLDEFVKTMDEMRRIRLRTGAFRWTLYRDVIQPLRFTEVFEVHTWDQHLQQHQRLDTHSLEVIARAITFDVDDGPKTVHLVAVDAESVRDASWSSIDLTEHDELHRSDGSIPSVPSRSSPTTGYPDNREAALG